MTWRWPWTARGRLDDALEQVAHLRAQVDRLTDALTRIGRREVGLPEEPRQARAEMKPMPPELKSYIEGHANKGIRGMMMREAFRRHGKGETWEAIVADVIPRPEPQEIP